MPETRGVETGTDQLRVGPWRKATDSQTVNDCVEVAGLIGGGRAVRDSKDRAGPVLLFTRGSWEAFTTHIRAGRLD